MSLRRVILTVLFVLPVFADDKLTGKIEVLPVGGMIGNWTVAGRTVQVNAQTKIDTDEGRAIVGACVDVKGNSTGNAIVARSIEIKEASKCAVRTTPPSSSEIEGVVEQLPTSGLIGDWKIAGVVVRVTAQTEIEQEGGPVSVGSCAEVEGTRNADGSLTAKEIETKNGSGGCRGAGDSKPQIEFRGTVQTTPVQGSTIWTISGRRVNITSTANITPRGRALAVNMCVEIEGRLENDGSVTASRVQILGDGVCTNGLERQEDVSFRGVIASLPASGLIGDWRVGVLTVRVTAQTRIDDDDDRAPAVGVCVEVKGDFTPTAVTATRIETKRAGDCSTTSAFRFDGIIQTLTTGAGTWQIGGRNVMVETATVFDRSRGATVVGACVTVLGVLEANGAVRAGRIEVLSASGACIVSGGVVGAANFSGFGVAPAQIISIFGRNIGPTVTKPLAVVDGRVSNNLANTRVLFDGTPASLLFASEGQINAIVPCNVIGKQTVRVQVESNGAWTNTVDLPVYPSYPSLFTVSNSGRGPAAALNFENGQYNTNPTPRGGVVLLFGTGEGQTTPACKDGEIVATAEPFPRPLLPVTVEVGGKPAALNYVGSAPGLVRGVFQINMFLSPDTPVGDAVPVVVKIGERTSQTGVTMRVR